MARLNGVGAVLCVCALMASVAGAADKPAKAPVKGPAKEKNEVLAAIEELQRLVLEQRKEIASQRAELREQAEKLARLQQRMETAAPAEASVSGPAAQEQDPQKVSNVELLEKQLEAVADSTNALQGRVATVETGITATNRANDGKFRQLGNLRFSGDFRFRYVPMIQEDQTTRHRQRIRLRFNVQGNITNTLFGGMTLASGTPDDPISTNQTLGSFFNRFNVGLDRAWIQWTPKKALRGHAVFAAGKFAYPWIRTPLTFDNDLNPNGIYTRVNWDFENTFFRGVTVVGMSLPIFERGGSTSTTTGVRADGYDTNMAGAQLQTRWKLGDRITFSTNLAYLGFNSPDIIAQAHSVTSATAAVTNNLTGNVPITNCVRTNATNQVVGYCSKFGYLNWVSTLGIITGYAKWPVNVTFDFNNNVRATRLIQRGTAAPTGRVDNPERSAYWAEIQFGRQSEQKDIQIGWVFARLERDSVITAFNESDFRAGSNLSQHRLNLYYRAFNNVTLSYHLWMGHVVNAADPLTGVTGAIAFVPGGKRAAVGWPCNVAPFTGCTDNMLKRMQFDFIYTF